MSFVDRASKLDALIDGAEELLTNLTDAHDPDIQNLRDRVDFAIADARRAFARGEEDVSDQLRHVAAIVDDYVREYPWLALATGVLVAGTIAFILGTASGGNTSRGRRAAE
jgi:ElaB/YqjD/DUF883 family membrane-anchored ribosome-binding protein